MMIRNVRLMLALGCVGLTALSIPAVSTPNPRGLEPQARAVIPRDPPARTATPAARQIEPRPAVSTRPAEKKAHGDRPLFGWPRLVSEARKYIGTNPTDMKRRWCARFLNLVLAKTGYAGTGSDAARSFASYGDKISQPKVGAIAVLSRGRNSNLGHVGVISGLDARGNPIIISGNHGRRVAESVYPRTRVIAYVMPTTRGHAPVLGRLATAPAARPPAHASATAAMASVVARRSAPPAVQQRPAERVEPRRIVQMTASPVVPQPQRPVGERQKPAFVVAFEAQVGKLFGGGSQPR